MYVHIIKRKAGREWLGTGGKHVPTRLDNVVFCILHEGSCIQTVYMYVNMYIVLMYQGLEILP